MNIIIITGASSGMGCEFAKQLDKSFHNIDEFWLIARDLSKLEKVSSDLNHRTRLFAMDLNELNNIDLLEDALITNNATIRILICSAGFGLMGSFMNLKAGEAAAMIQTNCISLTELTHRFIPYMKKNSRIIELSSSAAFLPQADFAVYAATKSYVLSFSQALNQELKEKGIKVTAVCPGPVDTPFFSIAERDGKTLSLKKHFMASAENVVRKAIYDSYHGHAVSVYGFSIKGLHIISKIIPHKFILEICSFMKKKGM